MEEEKKDSFVFFRSFYEGILNLPKENQTEILIAICEYSLNNKIPDDLSPVAKAMFTVIKPNIDNASKRYRASVENGKKGGRPRKNENLEKPNNNLEKPNNNLEKPNNNLTETQSKPNQNLNVDVDDNYNVNNNYNINNNTNTNVKNIKHKYGEYKKVKLTDQEYNKLLTDYGSSNLQTIIKYLDEYLEMKGDKYKSHYMVIKKWGAEAALKKEREQATNIFKSFLES